MTDEQRAALLEWLREEDRTAIHDLIVRFPPASVVRSDGKYAYPSKTNHGRVVSYTDDGQISVWWNDGPLGPIRGFCDPAHIIVVEYTVAPDEMRALIDEANATLPRPGRYG